MSGNASGLLGVIDVAMSGSSIIKPHRPAWVEIDRAQLRENFKIIFADTPQPLEILSVVKDDAYGHGAAEVAKIAVESGASFLGVSNIDEAAEIRDAGIVTPMLLFGENQPEEIPYMVEHGVTPCLNRLETAHAFSKLAVEQQRQIKVHVKIETGMGRYGVRWTEALPFLEALKQLPGLRVEGIMSHFARSDEFDKQFADLQLARFREVLDAAAKAGFRFDIKHLCNTGGFLDLPHAHFDMARIGILPLGVYPSQVCRRIPGLKPVMSVKSKISAIRRLEPGDNVGYGLRYQADARRMVAVIPLGYGDGYPRVRNEGHVLIRGRRAPVVGGNSMDNTMVDVTEIPGVQIWDEVVLMGDQGEETISVHDIAAWKKTVSYEVLANWRNRLPRIYHD